MFKKLRELIRPKEGILPFDLTPSELHALKEIRSHPQWGQYLSFLDKLTTFYGESMLQATKSEDVLFYRSYILGLRRAGTVVDELIKEEEARDARRKSGPTDLDLTIKRAAATYGTPYFRS